MGFHHVALATRDAKANHDFYTQAMGFRLGNGGGTVTQTHSHIHTGVLEVTGVGMTLGAKTEDGHFFALNNRKITVFIVISLHWFHLYFAIQKLKTYTRSDFSPRAIPETPERTTSRMQLSPSASIKASIFWLLPLIWIT